MQHSGMRVYLAAIAMFVSSLLARSTLSRGEARRKDTS